MLTGVRGVLAAVLALGAASCTGAPVGESASDAAAGSGGDDGGVDAALDATGDGAGAGGVQVLAAGRDCPADLRVVGGTITWVDQGSLQSSGKNGVVATMPAAGCGDDAGSCIVVLATDQSSPSAVEVDPATNDVFFATAGDGSIWRLPAASTTPENFASLQVLPRALALDETSLYWVNAGTYGGGDGQVRRRYLDGGTVGGIAILDALESPVSVELLAMKVFVSISGSGDTAGQIYASDITGAGGGIVASSQSLPRGLAIDATHAYWTNSGDGTIMRAPHDGSEPTQLLSGRPTPSDIAVDTKGIYWVEAGTPNEFSDGAVMAARLDGSNVVTLAAGQRDPRKLAQDSSFVYFLNRGTQGVKQCTQHDGSVGRVQKPW